MDFIISEKATNKHLIIFVHGLNGGASTWTGDSQRFVETCQQNKLIQDNFDLASFVYNTKIFQWTGFKKFVNTIRGFVANRTKEKIKAFNVGIETVARSLESTIRSYHEKYQSITIIAHSMGGLVAKSALTWLYEEDILKKVKLFISLDVPHMGASLANIGENLLGKNPQILDLREMGEFTTTLNERFFSLKIQPKIIYTWGHQDTVVPRPSAILTGVSNDLVEITEDDHFSIVLIENSKNNIVFRRIIKELKNLTQPISGIDVGVPQDTPFGPFITMVASELKVKVDLTSFTALELNTLLRGANITSIVVEDFFKKVGDLAVTTLPEYEVVRENGTDNYHFIKKNNLL